MPGGTSRKTGRTWGGSLRRAHYNWVAMAKRPLKSLPPVTIVIEWENAIDVEDKWTAAAMSALERELAEVGPRMAAKPRIMYLYDKGAGPEGDNEAPLDSIRPPPGEPAYGKNHPAEGLA